MVVSIFFPPLMPVTASGFVIAGSGLFDGSTSFLTRTPSSASNRKTWTYSVICKRTGLGVNSGIQWASRASNGTASGMHVYFTTGNLLRCEIWDGSTQQMDKITTQVFRDPAAFLHIVIACDSSNATAEDRWRIYINGVRITAFGTNTNLTLNYEPYWNSIFKHKVGSGDGHEFDGYIAQAAHTVRELSEWLGQLSLLQ
jgi:hypothetical protein